VIQFRSRSAVRLAIGAAICGVGVLTAATIATAAPGDPPGANGTVKIDGLAFDNGIDNEPHVTCEFQVDFFNFDDDEFANIVFTVQPPTGQEAELLRRDNQLVSNDPAGGGNPDPDETFAFDATQLGLDAYTPLPQQGFHVKLTIERIGAPGAGKHKVFWIEPCVTPTPSPTTPSPSPTTPSPSPTYPSPMPTTPTSTYSSHT
jgi:hypothetical protein